MKIEELKKYGIPSYFIETWQRHNYKQLFPFQAQILKQNLLFSQHNLVISSPTASGKTFLAELAAVKTILNNRKVVYLVPLRVLAQEKYEEFSQRYTDYGLKVVISSGERISSDRDIMTGQFDLAVVVFEKLLSFLMRNPTLINLIGLVVIDELQTIGQVKRGILLEFLISLLRKYNQLRLIGLSAVIAPDDPIIEWLDAVLCHSDKRLQELREGILMGNKFHYREFNSGHRGEEKLIDTAPGTMPDIQEVVSHLSVAGEQTVFFLPERQSTRSWALELAAIAPLKPAVDAIAELKLVEPSTQSMQLLDTLKKGVAFHNAELTLEERQIIERYFKQGQIRLLTATTTLAMGVNLPAKNVFIDPHIWRFDPQCKRPYRDIMSRNEKENEAGRAGRYGYSQGPGRVLITANSRKEFDIYWYTYIEGEYQQMRSCLDPDSIDSIILWLFCCTTQKVRKIESFLETTFATFLTRHHSRSIDWISAIRKNIVELGEKNIVRINSRGEVIVSELARIVACHGISVATAIELKNWLETAVTREVCELEILYAVSLTENGNRFSLSFENKEKLRNKYLDYILARLSVDSLAVIDECFERLDSSNLERLRAAKMSVLLNMRRLNEPTLRIEKLGWCLAGELNQLGEYLARILRAAAAISSKILDDRLLAKKISILSEEILYGVNAGAIELARIRIPYLGRERCARLAYEGFDTLVALEELTVKQLGAIIGIDVAKKIKENIVFRHKKLDQKTVKLSFSSSRKDVIEITHLFQGRHYFIKVNGQMVRLTRRLFEIILRLALELKKNPPGWVHKLDAAIADEKLCLITKLRSLLKPYLSDDPKSVIKSDQYGSLSIFLPEQNLILDYEKFSEHPHESIRSIITCHQKIEAGSKV